MELHSAAVGPFILEQPVAIQLLEYNIVEHFVNMCIMSIVSNLYQGLSKCLPCVFDDCDFEKIMCLYSIEFLPRPVTKHTSCTV